MKNILAALILILSASLSSAHLTYSGRDFGVFTADGSDAPVTISSNVSSTFGWAYSTDSDLGDSHRLRAFRFTLANAGAITIDVQSTGADTPLLPAFSIYSGLSHLAPDASGHDGTASTQQYLKDTYGDPHGKQGAFNALGNWVLGNDDTTVGGVFYPASLRTFTYIGNAADGTSANYGSAVGINGDGSANGFVSGTFYLPAGDYTIMVGGGMFADQYLPYVNYGVDVTISAVPEPGTWMLLGLALAFLGWRAIQRHKTGVKTV